MKNCIDYCMNDYEEEQDYDYCPYCGLHTLKLEAD